MSEASHSSNSLETPIQYIKGVGPKRANALESLNIFTIKDLLYYFPRKYVDRTSLSTIGSIKEGEEVNLVGRVKSVSLKRMKKGNFVTSTVADHTGSVRLMWFNAADYIHQSLKVGDLITIHGKVAAYKGNPQIVHPEYDKLNANEISLTTGFIIPVYPLTEDLKKSGLDNRNLRKIIYLALESVDSIDDHFDEEFRNKFEIGIGALPNNKNILGVSSQLLSSSKKDMLSGLGSQASPEMSKFNFNELVPGRMIAQPNANLVGFGFPFNG